MMVEVYWVLFLFTIMRLQGGGGCVERVIYAPTVAFLRLNLRSILPEDNQYLSRQ